MSRTTGTMSMSVRCALSWLSYCPLHFNVTPGGRAIDSFDSSLNLLDEAAKVPATDVALDEYAEQSILARDLARATGAPNRGDLPERDGKTFLGRNQNAADPFDIIALIAREPQLNRVACAPFDGGAHIEPSQANLDDVHHVADVQTVSGEREPVRQDFHVRLPLRP